MSRKRRIIIAVLCGPLILAFLTFLVLPRIYIAIGRNQHGKMADIDSALANLREKEFKSPEDNEEDETLRSLREDSARRAIQAFTMAKGINESSLNDEDLVALAESRSLILYTQPLSSYSLSEIEETSASIRSDLEKALQLNPRNKEAYSSLISTYYNQYVQDAEKTGEICDRFRAAFPDDLDMEFRCAVSTNLDDESMKQQLLKVIERDPSHIANLYLARLLEKELKLDDTIALLERWVASNPRPPFLGVAKSQLKSAIFIKESIEENKSLVEQNPNDVKAMKALADAYSDLRAHDIAVQWLEKAYRINPNDVEIISSLAFLKRLNGDTEGAVELYEKLISKVGGEQQRQDDIREFIIESYLEGGDLDKAMEWNKQLKPGSSNAIRIIAEIASYYERTGCDELADKYSQLFEGAEREGSAPMSDQ